MNDDDADGSRAAFHLVRGFDAPCVARSHLMLNATISSTDKAYRISFGCLRRARDGHKKTIY